MVGLYTCDPAKVVSNSKSLYWYTTHKAGVRSRLDGGGTRVTESTLVVVSSLE